MEMVAVVRLGLSSLTRSENLIAQFEIVCIGIVLQYAVFPWAVDRCKCSLSCIIPGLYEALLALSINFHNVCLLTGT
jgi:hypothetical protein